MKEIIMKEIIKKKGKNEITQHYSMVRLFETSSHSSSINLSTVLQDYTADL